AGVDARLAAGVLDELALGDELDRVLGLHPEALTSRRHGVFGVDRNGMRTRTHDRSVTRDRDPELELRRAAGRRDANHGAAAVGRDRQGAAPGELQFEVFALFHSVHSVASLPAGSTIPDDLRRVAADRHPGFEGLARARLRADEEAGVDQDGGP